MLIDVTMENACCAPEFSCFVLDVCGDGYIFFLEKAMHTFEFFSSRLCQINCPEHENNFIQKKKVSDLACSILSVWGIFW